MALHQKMTPGPLTRAPEPGGEYIRDIGTLERQEGDSRRFTLSFSSEEPYERWYGEPEILSHADGAVDLTRFDDGMGVLLFNHDRYMVLGKIVSAKIEDKRGVAEIEFDDDEDAEKVLKKVQSGTLKGVSVGYRVTEWQSVRQDEKTADGFEGPCYIARHWMPYEISIVSVPADASVGVGRDMEPDANLSDAGQDANKTFLKEEKAMAKVTENATANTAPVAEGERQNATAAPASPAQAAAPAVDADQVRAEERERINQITALCRDFEIDPAQYINGGQSLDAVRAAVLEQVRAQRQPVPARGTGEVSVQADEEDKFRAAAADGLLMRGGLNITAPAEGASDFRGASLRDLAIMTMQRAGQNVSGMLGQTADEIYGKILSERQFYSPTAAFPSILDTAIRKAYVQGHRTAPVTFDRFTRKGALKDFKTTEHNYIAGPGEEFLLVPEGGELKHSIPSDALKPTKKLATYGRQFTMTREAFINDDIGFLATMPARYAAAARKTINSQVYSIMYNNSTIYDGVALFHANHKNLMTSGNVGAPTMALVQKMILALGTQTDEFGQAAIIRPRYIVCGVGYGFLFYTIFHSATVQTSENTQAANPLVNYASNIEIIEDPTLNVLAGANACPWFIIADQGDSEFIEVDYLNGNDIPTIRRMETPGQLGFIWDIYLDWGVTVTDFRGAVKNPGAVIANPLG